MQLQHLILLSLLLILPSVLSCERESEYERLLQRELKKGVRNDSLFLGYHLGMERRAFFDHSWQLNQQGVVTGGVTVDYDLNELPHAAKMSYFPDFEGDKIQRMAVEISYHAWAPWNRDLYSDSLIVHLLEYYKEVYGNGFIETVHPRNGKRAWAKVDGNRQIMIHKHDDMVTRVEFEDLSAVETE